MQEKLEIVWKRQDECLVPVRRWDNNLDVSMELGVKQLKKLCKEVGVEFEDFLEYAQARAKKENMTNN